MPEPNLGLRESIKLIIVGGNASVLSRISIMHGGFLLECVCVPTDPRVPRGGLRGLRGMYAQREVAYSRTV